MTACETVPNMSTARRCLEFCCHAVGCVLMLQAGRSHMKQLMSDLELEQEKCAGLATALDGGYQQPASNLYWRVSGSVLPHTASAAFAIMVHTTASSHNPFSVDQTCELCICHDWHSAPFTSEYAHVSLFMCPLFVLQLPRSRWPMPPQQLRWLRLASSPRRSSWARPTMQQWLHRTRCSNWRWTLM